MVRVWFDLDSVENEAHDRTPAYWICDAEPQTCQGSATDPCKPPTLILPINQNREARSTMERKRTLPCPLIGQLTPIGFIMVACPRRFTQPDT